MHKQTQKPERWTNNERPQSRKEWTPKLTMDRKPSGSDKHDLGLGHQKNEARAQISQNCIFSLFDKPRSAQTSVCKKRRFFRQPRSAQTSVWKGPKIRILGASGSPEVFGALAKQNWSLRLGFGLGLGLQPLRGFGRGLKKPAGLEGVQLVSFTIVAKEFHKNR